MEVERLEKQKEQPPSPGVDAAVVRPGDVYASPPRAQVENPRIPLPPGPKIGQVITGGIRSLGAARRRSARWRLWVLGGGFILLAVASHVVVPLVEVAALAGLGYVVYRHRAAIAHLLTGAVGRGLHRRRAQRDEGDVETPSPSLEKPAAAELPGRVAEAPEVAHAGTEHDSPAAKEQWAAMRAERSLIARTRFWNEQKREAGFYRRVLGQIAQGTEAPMMGVEAAAGLLHYSAAAPRCRENMAYRATLREIRDLLADAHTEPLVRDKAKQLARECLEIYRQYGVAETGVAPGRGTNEVFAQRARDTSSLLGGSRAAEIAQAAAPMTAPTSWFDGLVG